MTLTDELKILDDRIKTIQAQYDLDREAAKITALSSKELNKYEYLSGEDLGYKLGVVEQAKFEYSPLGKVFNKGLKKEDKKEGLLKRLNSIEGKNEEQLKAIQYQGERQFDIINKQQKSPEAVNKQKDQLKILKKTNEDKLKNMLLKANLMTY